jgi:cytochrome c5
MRVSLLMLALFLALSFAACHHRTKLGSSSAGAQDFATLSFASTTRKPDSETEIKPIFQARCQPCHFQGGKVYDKMPFDKPETITRLGEKLFTRIKDKEEQRLIREFLAQP